jgi:hypothetical protein
MIRYIYRMKGAVRAVPGLGWPIRAAEKSTYPIRPSLALKCSNCCNSAFCNQKARDYANQSAVGLEMGRVGSGFSTEPTQTAWVRAWHP